MQYFLTTLCTGAADFKLLVETDAQIVPAEAKVIIPPPEAHTLISRIGRALYKFISMIDPREREKCRFMARELRKSDYIPIDFSDCSNHPLFVHGTILSKVFSHLSMHECAKIAPTSKRFYLYGLARIFTLNTPPEILEWLPSPLHLARLPTQPVSAHRAGFNKKVGKQLIQEDRGGFPTPHLSMVEQIEQPMARVLDPHGRLAIAVKYEWTLGDKSGSAVLVLHALHSGPSAPWTAAQAKNTTTKAIRYENSARYITPEIRSIVLNPEYLKRFLSGEKCELALIGGEEPRPAALSYGYVRLI